MFGNFVSELVKAAAVDLLFKRPIQFQLARDGTGKLEVRVNINPSSGGTQQPVVYVAPQQPYGGYGPGYPPPPYAYQPPYNVQTYQPPPSGAPSPAPEKLQQNFDLAIPANFRR